MSLKSFITSWGFIFLAALFDSVAAFVAKSRFKQLGEIDFSSIGGFFGYLATFLRSPVVIVAGLAFVSAPALWFLALAKIDLSKAYPLLVAFHLIFIFVLGVCFLGESLTTAKLTATILALASVILYHL